MHEQWNELMELAAGQGWLVTLVDGVECDISPSSLHDRICREGWKQPHPGVWLVPGHDLTQAGRRHLAAIITGPHGAISHVSAAIVHDMLLGNPKDRRTHVTVPAPTRGPRAKWVVAHRSRALDDFDTIEVDGLVVTTPARTLLDNAAGWSARQVLAVLLALLQRNLLTLDEVQRQLDRRPRLPGSPKVRRAMAAARGCTVDSILEFDVVSALRNHGYDPALQHALKCPDGITRHIDIAWPEHKFGIECDGWLFHNNRKAHDRDRMRLRQFQRLGWRIIAVTSTDIRSRRDAMLLEVEEAIGRPRT